MQYNIVLNKYLYNFIKEVIGDVAANGLEGDQHLLITFSTVHSGVVVSQKLRESFPEELTIIIDNEYYNLYVNNNGFSVQLVFDESGEEEIFVPYSSIIAFEDPSCDFSIDLEPDLSDAQCKTIDNIISFNDIKR